MKFKAFWIIFCAAILLGGCRGEEQHPGQTAAALTTVEVRSFTVSAQGAALQSEVVGTLQAVQQAVIAAKVTGSIEQFPVVLGSPVKTGDVLVQLRAGEISAKVLQAEAHLEQARRNLERERKLLLKNAATAEMVRSLEEMYRIAEAGHREAKSMLDYTTITAPFDGVVTAKNASVGDLATPGSPLLHLEDSRQLQVVAPVPETLVLHLRTGDTVPVHIPAAGLDLAGTVAEVSPVADPLSRTTTVKLNIEEAPQLRSGQFARVSLTGELKNALFVPAAAVQKFGQMDRIFVISGDTAHLRLVRTGMATHDQIEILAGLEPGEQVAVPTASGLVDGQKVTVVP
ncbi:MAG TPA: efflux RND transporter periplasmic adaptor subunit [Desulfobulbaceae bacterium]|nr:efflux RND transporter periplasmic adaptor subunit [Desulfobulbaceae bacterium]